MSDETNGEEPLADESARSRPAAQPEAQAEEPREEIEEAPAQPDGPPAGPESDLEPQDRRYPKWVAPVAIAAVALAVAGFLWVVLRPPTADVNLPAPADQAMLRSGLGFIEATLPPGDVAALLRYAPSSMRAKIDQKALAAGLKSPNGGSYPVANPRIEGGAIVADVKVVGGSHALSGTLKVVQDPLKGPDYVRFTLDLGGQAQTFWLKMTHEADGWKVADVYSTGGPNDIWTSAAAKAPAKAPAKK